MRKITWTCLMVLFVGLKTMYAQDSNCPVDAKEVSYDIILVAGQSNTYWGYPLDHSLDTVNSRVYSLRRYDGLDYRILPAKASLDFYGRENYKNSFVTNFSNLYVNDVLKDNNRKVLIIPCGYAATGILNWSKNQNLYVDAVNRVNYVLDNIPGSKLVAILWHQGEANIGWAPYQGELDKMIVDMRSDIKQEDAQQVPFILGGMVPYWVNAYEPRKQLQAVIKNTPNRVERTGYADPEFPTVIVKPNNNYDVFHFDGAGMREMGQRYYNAFLQMNNRPISSTESPNLSTALDVTNNAKVVIHPNPVTDSMNVTSDFKIKKVEIYDQIQKRVYGNNFNDTNISIPTNNLLTGVHIVLVTLENNSIESIKIIKK